MIPLSALEIDGGSSTIFYRFLSPSTEGKNGGNERKAKQSSIELNSAQANKDGRTDGTALFHIIV